ncbi:hypothetical protein DERP_002155 [Dermatophagoides pteronyssinus]|uniref:Uncharacterized protein n=1 Tax=Dermatophagoides pteronyssinus TaxID=6956 RepID=A0ABQ8JGX2_DERPT|nr:hypothetical protein DERP_002155 [Dermatophagoides pteronyssinus]
MNGNLLLDTSNVVNETATGLKRRLFSSVKLLLDILRNTNDFKESNVDSGSDSSRLISAADKSFNRRNGCKRATTEEGESIKYRFRSMYSCSSE